MARILIGFKKMIPRRLLLAFLPAYHFLLSFFAAVFYGFPSKQLTVIGVTGTKGKTTVVELLHEILAADGKKTASASSLRFRINQTLEKNEQKMTMPGRFYSQKFLRRALKAGCQYAILEVTSEGIKQFRHRFIDFDAALVTNIQKEHLEAHGGFEPYLRAKLDLFWRLKPEAVAVINQDDKNADRFTAATRARLVFFSKDGIKTGKEKFEISDLQADEEGIRFEIKGRQINSKLKGEFNETNIFAAIAVAVSQHISFEAIVKGIEKVKQIPGRLEFIQNIPFRVVVDYAHTPDSLRTVYKTLRKKGDLICVLGATGGGRDRWKRPEFGRIAAEFCRRIILTDEDPYDEDPVVIINEIRAGAGIRSDETKIIMDRKQAIGEAIREAGPSDTVIITGKGAEPWMVVKDGKKIPWDDREIVKIEIGKMTST